MHEFGFPQPFRSSGCPEVGTEACSGREVPRHQLCSLTPAWGWRTGCWPHGRLGAPPSVQQEPLGLM